MVLVPPAIHLLVWHNIYTPITGCARWSGRQFKEIKLLCFLVSGIFTRKGEIQVPEAKATVAL